MSAKAKFRVEFYQPTQIVSLLPFLTQHSGLNEYDISKLILSGALYRNHKRWMPDPLTAEVGPSDIIRLHCTPKTYPPSQLEKIQIINQTNNWIAIYKPPGIPSHETLDNFWQNAKQWVTQQLGEPVYSLSRLDVGTQGVLLMAKNPTFAKFFNEQLIRREVKKYYRVVTKAMDQKSLTLKMVHYMLKDKSSPKKVIQESEFFKLTPEMQGLYLKCEMHLDMSYLKSFEPLGLQEIGVHLITGRTHQIRAQLSASGYPLWGDSLYGGQTLEVGYEYFGLCCQELSFWDESSLVKIQSPLFDKSIWNL